MTKMTPTTEATTKIPDRLYFRIGDVAELVGVKPYVLRYWESEFPLVSPQKTATGQRVYRRGDVESLLLIKQLLYVERYSIEGARKRIKELRKDGTLKSFREAAAGGSPASISVPLANSPAGALGENASEANADAPVAVIPAGLTTDFVRKLRSEASELQSLADAPIQELFRY